jgi:hypothetical protein
MVAPFWADVDTRGGLGQVWMKNVTSTVFGVAWAKVGYYKLHGDKRNTFMVMLSDENWNNVRFCYEDMQWTTGDFSGGSGGFGGTPAIVGINKGDGIESNLYGLYNGKQTV